ncbi:DUF1993 family protein [Beijerinckia sp. L45]|uniref:DUF1993 domain-containing protein n=1 Tax=Beijerinckia sp. L45 TaxID=1641855 RepID=UPI00131DEA0A|nr:DUF1993 domain-containing protein [Beijerinckia sp. L45]
MSLTFFTASVPVFQRGLQQLSLILDKASAHATAAGIDPDAFVTKRLAPDMRTLAGQVQSASDAAKICTARLAGVTAPPFADTETTLAALQKRIKDTLAYIDSVPADDIAAAASRPISVKFGAAAMDFTAETYLFKLAIPNFFFHVTTAYDILRAEGVALGKTDYLGGL